MKRSNFLATLLAIAILLPSALLAKKDKDADTTESAETAEASSEDSKLSDDLKDLHPLTLVDVIVQYNEAPDAKSDKTLLKHGGEIKRELNAINARQARITVQSIRKLEKDDNILYISLDRAVEPELEFAAPAIGATMAHDYGYTGEGVGIAVIDSGVAEMSAVWEQTIYHESFAGFARFDEYGHGTHVAGILGGHWNERNGWSSSGPGERVMDGIAPKAHIISLKVLDREGRGTDSNVVAAINRAIELKDEFNIRIINLSIGRPVFESHKKDPLCQAVKAAHKAGILVVAAAGNLGRDDLEGTKGYGTIVSPGNSPFALTVGAMNDMGTETRADDRIASYSSKGPTAIDHFVKPDIVAPGNKIHSALAPFSHLVTSHAGNIQTPSFISSQNYQYFVLNGTSMAAPMVSGAAALLLEKDPKLNPNKVKAILMGTASTDFAMQDVVVDPATGETFTNYYDIFTVGAGYLDIMAALNETEKPKGNAKSPEAVFDEDTNTAHMVVTENSVWGSGAAWGSRKVWGSGRFVDGTAAVWGSRMVRGNAMLSSDALWGTAAVWGSRSMSGHSTLWGQAAVWGSRTGRTRAWNADTFDVQGLTVLLNGE